MKAMVFAAGLGTRLRPLTDARPKALVEVQGKPMLGHVIERLLKAGVDSFVINLHHFPQLIKNYVNEAYPGLDVVFSDESDCLLDTGGGLLKARRLLAEETYFIVQNADVLTDAPVGEMIERHLATQADVTLLTSNRDSSRRLMFDSKGRLKGWHNRLTDVRLPEDADFTGCEPRSFNGVHIISGSVLERLADYGSDVFSIVPFYASEAARLKILSYAPTAPFQWFDIGSPQKLADAEQNYRQTD